MNGWESRIYAGGRLVATGDSLDEACRLRAQHGGLSVIVVRRPGDADLAALTAEFDLHPMAVEDAAEPRQRAKFDRYGDTAFVALRPARYLDVPETVEVGEVDMFVGTDFAIVATYDDVMDLADLTPRLESEAWLTERGGLGVMYAVLDLVVDGYLPVLDGLENDIDEIEDQVFGGDRTAARRIYELAREAIALQRAIHPLPAVLRRAGFAADAHLLVDDGHDLERDELRAGLADVWDHVSTITERIDALRAALSDILQTNAALVGLEQNARVATLSERQFQQNEQVKKISAWAAIILAPTIVTGIYGMNFEVMPELTWSFGYPLALLLMGVLAAGLYVRYKRIGWL